MQITLSWLISIVSLPDFQPIISQLFLTGVLRNSNIDKHNSNGNLEWLQLFGNDVGKKNDRWKLKMFLDEGKDDQADNQTSFWRKVEIHIGFEHQPRSFYEFILFFLSSTFKQIVKNDHWINQCDNDQSQIYCL